MLGPLVVANGEVPRQESWPEQRKCHAHDQAEPTGNYWGLDSDSALLVSGTPMRTMCVGGMTGLLGLLMLRRLTAALQEHGDREFFGAATN